ncbi:MAG: Z1 domain-containing protein [Archangium sp.]|nr:Z1 domain-containing protein [Archangium sp.]
MSNEWLDPKFDRYRAWIAEKRNADQTWEEIELGGLPKQGLDAWLDGLELLLEYPSLASEKSERAAVWRRIVLEKRNWEEAAIRQGQIPLVLGQDALERTLSIPRDPNSSWALYREHLKQNAWKPDAIERLEESSFKILRRLRIKTKQPDGAVKGMVVGYVQSGKTASMAGLMAMAAEWGWNLFIVLSGTIENLRQQTATRLVGDLNRGGNLSWSALEQPHPNASHGQRAQDREFSAASKQRYLIVTLKNKTRLDNLINWLSADANTLAQMRILIIDDEADQASVDSSPKDKEDRTAINRRIVRLTQLSAAAVNYVAYTATPYANFLNEAFSESLYPRDFIVALPQSDEHFGTKQIFGSNETDTGLGITIDVPEPELEELKALHTNPKAPIPKSLLASVTWFLCAAAVFRHQGIVKPVSMLVHTSSQQNHHKNVAEAIALLIEETSSSEMLSLCESTWKRITAMLTKRLLAERFPNYGRLDDLTDYPSFDSLRRHIKDMIGVTPSHIPIEQRQGVDKPKYHRGVHVCIDNCANNGVNDEGEYVRLWYPGKDALADLKFAPAFVVVGGTTLSRGLTIENLVSTYFLRSGAQMDTLMQMGRWFGFRPGYELLPRIWMPAETKKKFVFMTSVEEELRDDLARFMDLNASPLEYGPRVKTHPSARWLAPTSRNKMKEALEAEFDFSGANKQETLFSPEVQVHNLENAEKFLATLGPAQRAMNGEALVWRTVDSARVTEFLTRHKFHPRLRFFSDLEPFSRWLADNQSRLDQWSVVVGGSREGRPWRVGSEAIGVVDRTQLADGLPNALRPRAADGLAIGVLRAPDHLFADVAVRLSKQEGSTNAHIAKIRSANGLTRTPQLLLYRINGGSQPSKSESRLALGSSVDLLGISIWVPLGAGKSKQNFATHLTVRIPEEIKNEGDDVEGAA